MADEATTSDLPERFTAVTEDELFEVSEYQGVPGSYLSKFVRKSILLGYKSLVHKIIQDGTASAPAQNELKNEVGTVSWVYDNVGRYQLSSSGLFLAAKTHIANSNDFVSKLSLTPIILIGTGIVGYWGFFRRDDNNLELRVVDNTFAYVELGSLIGTATELHLPEIRVYY